MDPLTVSPQHDERTRNGGIRVNQNPSTDEGVEFHGTFHSLVHSNGSFYPIEAYLELKRDNEGATQYAELEHIHQVEALVASNDHAIFAIDTQSGEDGKIICRTEKYHETLNPLQLFLNSLVCRVHKGTTATARFAKRRA